MRRPVPAQARSRSRFAQIVAPIRGLTLNGAAARPDPLGAEVLENWIPTPRGIRVRGGMRFAADIGAPVVSMMTYNHPTLPKAFAASASAIYDISDFNPATVAPKRVHDQLSGYYASQQVGTVGGQFLLAVNGADLAQIYDGANWNPLTDQAVSNLDYDGQTSPFTKGETLTGATSGSTAKILAVSPTRLKLGTISGPGFQDNEAITSPGGAAVANGTASSASAFTITGVDTATLRHVWLYANRLFFVERDSLRAWYLPVAQVGGAAVSFSLAGIFKRGGALAFGATWSLDTGDGLDDKCVFVSDLGEVAIYEGTDPSDPANWALAGRYDIARPLGMRGQMQAGGDLLLATRAGIVPLSQVIQKDPAALALAAVSAPIEPLWTREAARVVSPVEIVKWSDNDMALVVLPESDATLTVSLQTGAWASQKGWTGTCGAVFQGKGYLGRASGHIVELDSTGSDEGEAFTARYCGTFQDLGRPADYKRAQVVRPHFFASGPVTSVHGVAFDYAVRFAAPPPPTISTGAGEYMVWDASDWDAALWWSDSMDDLTLEELAQWRSIYGAGSALAATVQITSGSGDALPIELTSIDIGYEVGGSVV